MRQNHWQKLSASFLLVQRSKRFHCYYFGRNPVNQSSHLNWLRLY